MGREDRPLTGIRGDTDGEFGVRGDTGSWVGSWVVLVTALAQYSELSTFFLSGSCVLAQGAVVLVQDLPDIR